MADREWRRSWSSPHETQNNNHSRFLSRQISGPTMYPQQGILPTYTPHSRFERSASQGLVSSIGRRTMEGSRSIRNNFNSVFEELQPLVDRVRSADNMQLGSWLRFQQRSDGNQTNTEPPPPHPDDNSIVIDLEGSNMYLNNTFNADVEAGIPLQNIPQQFSIQPTSPLSMPSSSTSNNSNNNNNNSESTNPSNAEENASNDLRQNPEATALFFLIGRYLPFVIMIVIKAVTDHISTIILFCGFFGLFRFYNDFVKREIAKQSQRSIFYLILGILHLIVSICFFYYFYYDLKLHLSLIFIPPIQQPVNIGDLLWLVAITDFILKLITIIFKIFITLLPVRLLPTLKRGKWYLLVEVSSQLYRGLVPTQPWLYFLLESYKGPKTIIGLAFSAAYMVSKGTDLMKSLRIWWTAVVKFLNNVQLGVSPSKEQLAVTGGQCPICHDEFDSPVMLECNHVFCEACVAKWFDREPTCPLCRAKVTGDPSWRDGSTTYFIQLF